MAIEGIFTFCKLNGFLKPSFGSRPYSLDNDILKHEKDIVVLSEMQKPPDTHHQDIQSLIQEKCFQ